MTIRMSIAAAAGVAALGMLWQAPALPLRADNPPAASKEASLAFRQVVKKVLPAVVSVDAKQVKKAAKNPNRRGRPRLPPGMLEELEQQGIDPNQIIIGDQQPDHEVHGFGSGVIIRASGVVLTNNHVVEGAESVTVILQDGRKFTSKEVRRDPASDLAVIVLGNVKADLPFAEMGDSDAAEVGDWVLAMGAPFELQGTVTKGIISAKGRALSGTAAGDKLLQQDFLQTDAAINPGNSGGPLVDLDGKIVGINTAIESPTRAFAGISYSVPASIAKGVVEQLLKNGRVARSYVGVSMEPLEADIAKDLGLDRKAVLVTQVMPNGPAAKAGVKNLDVVVAVGGKPIESPTQMSAEIMKVPVGTAADFTVLRDKQQLTLRVTMEERPADYGARARVRMPGAAEENPELNPAEAEVPELGIVGMDVTGGVRIVRVKPGSIAQKSGLAPRMVIERAAGKPVAGAADLSVTLKEANLADGVLLVIRMGDNLRTFVKVREE